MRFWITALAVLAVVSPLRAEDNDPDKFLRASLVRLRLNDLNRSEKNLYTAILRARKTGTYEALAADIRRKPVYRELLTSTRNAYMLDLFDAEGAGTITFETVKERLREPEALRDALANTVPRAHVDALRPPERALCEPSSACTALHLQQTMRRADEEFDAGRYYEAAGLYGLAVSLSEKGARLSKDNLHLALTRRGVCLRALGLLQQSLAALRRAVKEFQNSSMVQYELAATYSRLGALGKAKRHLKKCVAYAKREGNAEEAVNALLRDPDFDAIKRTKTFARLVREVR